MRLRHSAEGSEAAVCAGRGINALEIRDSDNKQLLLQRIGLSPFKEKPLPQSLSSSAFRVKCILPSLSSSRFTTGCLQDLLAAEAGITHPLAPRANVLLPASGMAEPGAGTQAAGDAHLCQPPGSKGRHRAPLGLCVSAESAPAELGVHCSNWSLGSCIFWWGPESGTASLQLPRHSPSSHLWRGNVCHSTWGQVQRLLPALESSWLHSCPWESSQEEVSLEHTELLPPQHGHTSPGVIHICQRSGAALLPQPSPAAGGVWGLLVQTPSQGCDKGFCTKPHRCYCCGWELKQSQAASNLEMVTKKSLILEKL